jgi:hypothetical protein
LQSPLKFASPSPKLSERVTSPLTTASTVKPSMFLSPSKGVGIGATWSAALDEQLNKPVSEPSTQTSTSKELGKENISGSQGSKTELSKAHAKKPANLVIDREVLSPELV